MRIIRREICHTGQRCHWLRQRFHRDGRSTGPASGTRRRLAVVFVAVAVAAAAATTAWGQKLAPAVSKAQSNGVVVQMPGGKVVSRRSGLQLEVDTRWIHNFGYRPIRVRAISPKPTTADHSITVRLYVASSDWWTGATAVEQDFEFPLGSTSADCVISCPQYHSGHRCWWDAWVDGVKDEDLSVDMNSAWQFAATAAPNPSGTNLKFLMLGAAAQANQTVNPGDDLFEALVLMVGDLPEQWIDYTTFDVISLTPAEMAIAAETRPQALAAILRWVRSGGQLWISNVGRNWERLGDVERLLGMPSADSSELAARGWTPLSLGPRLGRRESRALIHLPTGGRLEARDSAVIEQLQRDPNYVPVAPQRELAAQMGDDDPETDETSSRPSRDRGRQPADSSNWYVDQRYGLGTVRVFRRTLDPAGMAMSWRMLMGIDGPQVDPTMQPDATRQPATPLEGALTTLHSWESRHGMTPNTANGDFANLLVPGVGQAPVTEFRVLITLFVLAIGPGNYWLLKRTNRLHLLVLTVPIMAAVLTVGLFAYALVSDGFRTLVRVHSFTALDQRSGEAVCWARLSYYAGLAPSSGLVMPDDVVVYPVLASWNEGVRRNPYDVVRQLEWRPAEADREATQCLTQGWLRSRTPTQYLTIRARQSPHRLIFRPTETSLSATNEMGTAIVYLAAIDEQGNYFAGQNLADRAAQTLEPATQLEVLQELRTVVLENKPEPPMGLVDDGSALIGAQRRSYRRRFGWDYSNERLANNLAGEAVASLVGTSGQPALDLPPRSYVAITEAGPEVTIGVPDAKFEACFHVVVGKW